jgi:putative acetyltransferase
MNHRNSHVIYLGGVAIAPSYSGKGLGEKMLREVVQLCNEQNYKRIELTVATINLKAIRLYEKLGFLQAGVLRKLTWLKKEDKFLDEVMMSLLLCPVPSAFLPALRNKPLKPCESSSLAVV